MGNPEIAVPDYFGIEQHHAGAANVLKSLETVAGLMEMREQGISLESDAIRPLLEALEVGGVSTESLGEKIAALYQRLLDALVKAWDYMVVYADNVYLQTSRMISAFDDIEEDAKGRVGSVAKSKVVKIDSSYSYLLDNYKPLPAKERVNRLNDLTSTLDLLLIEHVSEVMNISKFISPLVESLLTVDVRDPEVLNHIKNDARAIAKFGNEVHEHVRSYRGDDISSGDGAVYATSSCPHITRIAKLLGNKMLLARYGNVDKAALRGEGLPFFQAIDTVFNCGLIMTDIDSSRDVITSGDVPTLTPDEIIAIADAMRELVKPIRKFKMRYDRDMKLQRKRYQQLRGKLSVISRAGDNSDVSLYLRRVGNAAMGLSRWYYEPFIPMISHVLKVIRVNIAYCEKSITQWPVK